MKLTSKDLSPFVLVFLGIIFICGFYLRIESIRGTEVTSPLIHDAGNYYMYAYNLRHKHIYSSEVGNPDNLKSPVTPDAVRSPGYPLFLTLFVDGLPHKKIIYKILTSQMIISTLTILVAFLFFQSFLSKVWGTVAALLVALSPHLIVANSYILTETLFCFFIVVIGCLISLFVAKPSLYTAGIIGAAMGIASLVRPSLQYFPIATAFFLVFHYGRRKGTHFILMMLLGFALTFTPWIIRNVKTLNIIADKSLMINFLHHGLYPDFTFDETPESYGFPYRDDPRSEEISKDVVSVLKEIARRFRLEPLKHLKWFILKKPVSFWSWNIVQGGDAFVYSVSRSPYFSSKFFMWTHHLMHFLHGWLILLCLFGSLMAWLPISIINLPEKSIYVARFASILLIYFTIIHMLGAPFPRYSIPLRPFLYGMALFTPYFLVISIKKYRKNQNLIPSR